MIPMEYLFRRDVFQDPRNMQKEDIIDQLNHIYARQEQFGPEDAFRFSHYLDNKNKLLPAFQDSNRQKDSTKKSSRRGKGKGKQTEIPRADDFQGLIPLEAYSEEQPGINPELVGTQLIDPALVNLRHDGTFASPAECNERDWVSYTPDGGGTIVQTKRATNANPHAHIAGQPITVHVTPAGEENTAPGIPAGEENTAAGIPAGEENTVHGTPAEEENTVPIVAARKLAAQRSKSKSVRFDVAEAKDAKSDNKQDDLLEEQGQCEEKSQTVVTRARKRLLDVDQQGLPSKRHRPNNRRTGMTGRDDDQPGFNDETLKPQTRSRTKRLPPVENRMLVSGSSDNQAGGVVRRPLKPTRKSSRFKS